MNVVASTSVEPLDERRVVPVTLAAAGAVWLAIAALYAARAGGHMIDDFFITFRYAQNLAHGAGFVFNAGERSFGTTAPGYALALGVAAAITRQPVHVLALLVSVLALPAVAVLALAGSDRRPEAIAGGTLLLTCAYFWIQIGSEIFPVLLLLATAAALARSRPLAAGTIAGFAVWVRPDALVGALAIAAILAWRSRSVPWRYGIPVAGVVAAGLALARWWFGTALPSTLAAKRIQAGWMPQRWPSGWHFWSVGFASVRLHFGGNGTITLIVLGLLGVWPLLRYGGDVVRTLALYGLGVAAAYPLLHVPFYPWYALAPVASLLYGFAFACGTGLRWGLHAPRHPVRLATAMVLSLVVAFTLDYPASRAVGLIRQPPPDRRFLIYRATGEWLASHVPPSSRFAAVEVGTVAYFAQRPATDLLGLVSPEVLPRVRRGDVNGAFLHHPADVLLVTSWDQLLHAGERKWFHRYELAAEIHSGADPRWVRIYRLKPGLPMPGSWRHQKL